MPIRRISRFAICVFVVIMAELTQRQQERIAKSSSDRLRSQLVRGGADEGEVVQMDRDELKAAAAQTEVEKHPTETLTRRCGGAVSVACGGCTQIS